MGRVSLWQALVAECETAVCMRMVGSGLCMLHQTVMAPVAIFGHLHVGCSCFYVQDMLR